MARYLLCAATAATLFGCNHRDEPVNKRAPQPPAPTPSASTEHRPRRLGPIDLDAPVIDRRALSAYRGTYKLERTVGSSDPREPVPRDALRITGLVTNSATGVSHGPVQLITLWLDLDNVTSVEVRAPDIAAPSGVRAGDPLLRLKERLPDVACIEGRDLAWSCTSASEPEIVFHAMALENRRHGGDATSLSDKDVVGPIEWRPRVPPRLSEDPLDDVERRDHCARLLVVAARCGFTRVAAGGWQQGTRRSISAAKVTEQCSDPDEMPVPALAAYKVQLVEHVAPRGCGEVGAMLGRVAP